MASLLKSDTLSTTLKDFYRFPKLRTHLFDLAFQIQIAHLLVRTDVSVDNALFHR